MARWQRYGNTSDFVLTVLYLLTAATKHFGKLIYPLRNILEVAEYRIWLDQQFSKPLVVRNKKRLLDLIIKESLNGRQSDLSFIEFGVAFGETAKYLAEKVLIPCTYHGFDTFTGLPRAWRRLPKGAFSTGGEPPFIPRANFNFHKGLISETISNVDFTTPGRKVIIFDFDLFEPTMFALEWIGNDLNTGDIVYFDEAFDADERLIIQSYFLPRYTFRVLGASVFGIAFILE